MCVCPSAHVQAGEEKDRTEEEEGITQPLPLSPMSPIHYPTRPVIQSPDPLLGPTCQVYIF